jgi:hypothetical protein
MSGNQNLFISEIQCTYINLEQTKNGQVWNRTLPAIYAL